MAQKQPSRLKRPVAKRPTTWLALGVTFVGAWEGLQTVAYRDPIGVATACYGETRGIKMGDRFTKEQCDAMLADGLLEFAAGIERCLPPGTPDTRRVAAVSLAYNIGQGAFLKSTVCRRLQAGDVQGACDAFMMWAKAGGIEFRGLVNRRKAERELCLRP